MASNAVALDAAVAIPRRWIVGGFLCLLGAIFVLAVKMPVALLAVPLVIPAIWTALARPGYYTLLAIGLLYTNAPTVAVHFHGVPMIVGMALVPGLLAIPIVHGWLFERRAATIDPVFQLGVVYLLAQLFATLFSENRRVSQGAILETASEGLLLYLLVFNAVRSATLLRQVIWTLLLCGAAIGGLCFFQNATKTHSNNYGGFAQLHTNKGGFFTENKGRFFTDEADLQGRVRQSRLAGPVGEENRFAQVMLMLVPLGLFRFWGETTARCRVAALGMTALVSLGLLLAFSRASAVGFGVMLAGMMVLKYIDLRQSLLVVAGVVLMLLLVPQYLTRMALLNQAVNSSGTVSLAEADGSVRGRLTEAMAAVYMFADHPWTGVGPGMYRYHYQHYAEIVGSDIPGAKIHEELRQPHVLYLGVAAETGLPGIAALLLMVTVLILRLEHARRISMIAGRRDLAFLAAGFLFAIVGYLSTGFFLHFAFIRYFWLMAALASAASAIVIRDVASGVAAPATPTAD